MYISTSIRHQNASDYQCEKRLIGYLGVGVEGVSQHRKGVKGGDKVADVCRFRLKVVCRFVSVHGKPITNGEYSE